MFQKGKKSPEGIHNLRGIIIRVFGDCCRSKTCNLTIHNQNNTFDNRFSPEIPSLRYNDFRKKKQGAEELQTRKQEENTL
jgi:hypothetical protein